MGPPKTFAQATPPPTINQAQVDQQNADLIRKRQGSAATYVSTAAGRSTGGVAAKMLLGQGG